MSLLKILNDSEIAGFAACFQARRSKKVSQSAVYKKKMRSRLLRIFFFPGQPFDCQFPASAHLHVAAAQDLFNRLRPAPVAGEQQRPRAAGIQCDADGVVTIP